MHSGLSYTTFDNISYKCSKRLFFVMLQADSVSYGIAFVIVRKR